MGKKIGLSLGSGGSRGLSEIGVLLWLKENNVEISYVSGCSMGSIIGAYYCAGFTPEQLKDIVLGIKWTDILKYLKVSFSVRSIFDWSRISKFLNEDLGHKRIEDLNIPFACVAADINSGREFVFKKGKVVTAVSASSSIPGVFPPVEILGRLFVDGELVNPVPMDIAFELGADLVIGVNTCRSLQGENRSPEVQESSFVEKMDDWFGEMLEKVPGPLAELYNKLPHPDLNRLDLGGMKFYNVITESLAIVSSRIMDFKTQFAGPHFLINPQVGRYKNFDFDKAEEIIDLGYRAAKEAGPKLLDFIEEK
ncbi:MAG: patatin-like phospholipase family protein [Candidatus Krumholzibacteriota bacterium]|nr:patatin-like phospholipase family protein [Candidatus Krumholzibacteriota bacterium]